MMAVFQHLIDLHLLQGTTPVAAGQGRRCSSANIQEVLTGMEAEERKM